MTEEHAQIALDQADEHSGIRCYTRGGNVPRGAHYVRGSGTTPRAIGLDLTRFGGHPKCGALPRRGCLDGEARAAKKAFVHTGVQG